METNFNSNILRNFYAVCKHVNNNHIALNEINIFKNNKTSSPSPANGMEVVMFSVMYVCHCVCLQRVIVQGTSPSPVCRGPWPFLHAGPWLLPPPLSTGSQPLLCIGPFHTYSTWASLYIDTFKLEIHYEVRTVRKRAVGIQLQCFLVNILKNDEISLVANDFG